MAERTIKVRITESGDLVDVVVHRMQPDRIEVVLGTGQHSMTCELTPTRTGQAYAGSVMGRELVYERSREDVRADVNRAKVGHRPSRPPR